MAQDVEHAPPRVEVRSLKGLTALGLALCVVVLGKAAVHDVALVMELGAHVSDDDGD